MNKKYEKLAELAVCTGVNVQKGQPVVIRAALQDKDFVCLLAEKAYAAGASRVEVDWACDELSRITLSRQTPETLKNPPGWIKAQADERAREKYAYITVLSGAPDAFKNIDPARMNAYTAGRMSASKNQQKAMMNGLIAWTIVGIPSYEWAVEVFPDTEREEAFKKLEEALFAVTRVSDDNDPRRVWLEQNDILGSHAEKLNAFRFKALHFTSGLGTDLTVGLVHDHIWCAGGAQTADGVFYMPNLPTEECFTMPDRNDVNGVVCASRPLSHNGHIIDKFRLCFTNGKVTESFAEINNEALNELLNFDEGSRRIGEVALVPCDSPIFASGILFLNTLYDENAACHLALGQCYPENIQGGETMSEAQLLKAGGNHSDQHIDFMFGTEDMDIDGIKEDGETVPVFRNGRFVID